MGAPAGEHTLLCERCGYVVEGLPGDRPCPECGLAIAHSLPERRAGSPWQRRPGPAAWLRTCRDMLLRPAASLSGIAIEPVRSRSFGRCCIHVSAATIAAAICWPLPVSELPGRSETLLALVIASAVVLAHFEVLRVAAVAVLYVLTAIESRGVRFFGNRRGWRVTPTVATAVCGHACVGWVVAAALGAAGVAVVEAGLVRGWAARPARIGVVMDRWTGALPPAVGFMTGLLVFEVLVYMGVRRNRFANRAAGGASDLSRVCVH